jgi:putative ABC transport system substrate-binding protein
MHSLLAKVTYATTAEPNGGLFLAEPPRLAAVLETILRLAPQHQLPTISENRSFAVEGGLMSYGSNLSDLVRRAPSYVDRILAGQGERGAGRVSNRIRMIINLKTAKTIGLTIPKIVVL